MSEDLLALTAQIVSAHVQKNTVEVADLPALIRDVFRTLSGLGEAAPAPAPEAAKPAVPAAR
ncbi:MAG: MucR family transcriptional regulator [Acetobacteraceae bacterium]